MARPPPATPPPPPKPTTASQPRLAHVARVTHFPSRSVLTRDSATLVSFHQPPAAHIKMKHKNNTSRHIRGSHSPCSPAATIGHVRHSPPTPPEAPPIHGATSHPGGAFCLDAAPDGRPLTSQPQPANCDRRRMETRAARVAQPVLSQGQPGHGAPSPCPAVITSSPWRHLPQRRASSSHTPKQTSARRGASSAGAINIGAAGQTGEDDGWQRDEGTNTTHARYCSAGTD
ncbi:hypothetical protein E2C01_017803 [Portunus trituberculatus]|uniref:Uncharacterized protein n=1 Tax=Portunus trituberculatus TaxID=210409 RepID=A0A5B7DUT3_PORTR|nr:hypothetical protein [Portunus trituberculatus]